MIKSVMASATLALMALPNGAQAQEGAKFDCAVSKADANLKASIGAAMASADEDASRDVMFQQFAAVVDRCAAQHAITDAQKDIYFEYSVARIAREWLSADVAKFNLSTSVVDTALDFGPDGTNPDLANAMTEDHINKIVGAYLAAGVDVEAIDTQAWEKVGSYAAATSIYWIKRAALPF